MATYLPSMTDRADNMLGFGCGFGITELVNSLFELRLFLTIFGRRFWMTWIWIRSIFMVN